MTGFSLGDALGAGFGLIVRRPAAVLAWALAYFVIGVLPILLLGAIAAPDVIEAVRQARLHAHDMAGPPAWMPSFLLPKLLILRPVAFVASLAGRAVLTAAVLRAVLEPHESRFAYLRLGVQELWLALLYGAFMILMVAAAVLLVIPFAIVGGAAYYGLHGSAGAAPAVGLLAALCLACYVGVLCWIALRLSMAAPMTFAAREFRLFESWTLTRGHVGELFALLLLLAVVVLVAGLVVNGALWTVAIAAFGSMILHPERLQALFAQPVDAWLPLVAPWAVLATAVFCVLVSAFTAILLAPWAVAYRQLTAAPDSRAATNGQAPA